MPRPTTQSYLLRLWRNHADAPLRATLIAVENPGSYRHFDTLDELMSFLIGEADVAAQRELLKEREKTKC